MSPFDDAIFFIGQSERFELWASIGHSHSFFVLSYIWVKAIAREKILNQREQINQS